MDKDQFERKQEFLKREKKETTEGKSLRDTDYYEFEGKYNLAILSRNTPSPCKKGPCFSLKNFCFVNCLQSLTVNAFLFLNNLKKYINLYKPTERKCISQVCTLYSKTRL